uniref:Uncharacterized protein n=1 Tax=Arundo donax TaxID=35708 RepID=A0A0A9AFQ1_ARUDO
MPISQRRGPLNQSAKLVNHPLHRLTELIK